MSLCRWRSGCDVSPLVVLENKETFIRLNRSINRECCLHLICTGLFRCQQLDDLPQPTCGLLTIVPFAGCKMFSTPVSITCFIFQQSTSINVIFCLLCYVCRTIDSVSLKWTFEQARVTDTLSRVQRGL